MTPDEAFTLTTADPAAIALAPPGTPMYRTTYDNVAPRLGAAYGCATLQDAKRWCGRMGAVLRSGQASSS
jgi:hypothetical protein